MRYFAALLFAGTAACSSTTTPLGPADAGAPDEGTFVLDSGAVPDAAPSTDASALADAAIYADAATLADATAFADASSPADATVHPDATVFADAAIIADATIYPDATTFADATVYPDAAVRPDAATYADAATYPDAAACTPVSAAPDVDPWLVRGPGEPFNRIATQGSTIYLVGPSDYIQLGASLAWGGAVTWFGLAADSGSNVIDANDTGRELQLALYDPTRAHQPCAATATCLSAPQSCGDSISYLGWDPVQGGDRCGNGATVLSSGRHGDGLRVVVQPLHWNPDWDHPNCDQQCGISPVQVTYTLDFRFVHPNVVEIATEVTSQESIDHPLTSQEFPTLYVAHGQGGPDLPHLLDASGQEIAITNPANDGFTYANFTSPGPWVTWQNTNHDYGVALIHDQGLRDFQGWTGDGQHAPYFHNVRGQMSFGLSHGGLVRGIAYLALGSFSTVDGLQNLVLGRRPPFGVVDAPAGGSTVRYTPGARVGFYGWVLDNRPGTAVTVELDGQVVGSLATGAARPDVCEVYPMYEGCPNVGYAGDIATAGLSACPHLARVVATDSDGNRTILGERVLDPR